MEGAYFIDSAIFKEGKVKHSGQNTQDIYRTRICSLAGACATEAAPHFAVYCHYTGSKVLLIKILPRVGYHHRS